jgi:hypothetical protein
LPGAFTFRFWIDDVAPPAVRLLTRAVKPGGDVKLAVTDAASGVDPSSLVASIDGKAASAVYAQGRVAIPMPAALRGRHRIVLGVSDFQELKNMENVPRILPNTRVFRATVTIR